MAASSVDPAKDGADTVGASPALEIVLYPNPPLGQRGFVVLMLALAALTTALGTGFWLVGAWPVTGLLGLDLVLLWGAFRIVRRRARRHETVRLDPSGLEVARVGADGRTLSWRFEPSWVRVEIDRPPRRDSLITLSSHGRSLRFGALITPEERVEVADALRGALAARRFVGPLA